MDHKKLFAVSYTVDYQHRVVVGITATDKHAAITIACNALNDGLIWDNNPNMPLLFDGYEEVNRETLRFDAEEIASLPEPDESVEALLRKDFAFMACHALLANDVEKARSLAEKATPRLKLQ